MAISERINPDNLNIHQFQETPEGRPELPFDPEKIDAYRKKRVIEFLMDIDPNSFFENIMAARILWPEENFNRYTKSELENELNSSDKNTAIVCGMVTFYPEFAERYKDIDYTQQLNNVKKGGIEQYSSQFAKLKIINPQLDVEFSAKDTEELLKVTQTEITKAKARNNLSDYKYFAENLAALRIIDPNYKPEIDLSDWKGLTDCLNRMFTFGEWNDYITHAANLKILAAYKVEVSGPGIIDIQMSPPRDVNSSTPSIPKTRKF
jgi:hypothetical protein